MPKERQVGALSFILQILLFQRLYLKDTLAFSKNTLSNYAFINERVKKAILSFLHGQKGACFCKIEPQEPAACHSFCMAKPTKYDVMIEGKKAAGAAQRTKHFGYLHEGTISLGKLDPQFLKDVLKSDKDVLEAMERYTFAPLGSNWKPHLQEARGALKKALIEEFQR